ncbi:hypothetical protein [Ideonella margarita]|uniref:VCBS repeat-containing protein n=1 Tax=Ideonella margarita TaxID=2984191 RepID=A0ABU9C5S0_9BURK
MNALLLLPALYLACVTAQAAPAAGSLKVAQQIAAKHPKVRWDLSTLVEGDFNGDRKTDIAFAGYNTGGVLIAVSRATSSKKPRATQFLQFAISPSIQAAICEAPAQLQAEKLLCSPMGDPLPGCKPSRLADSLYLTGGDCDPINLYWSHTTNRMDWWRL